MARAFPLQGDRDDMEFWLGRKAAADAAFRQALLRDTRRTLEEIVGKRMPRGLDVRVLEETPQVMILVKRIAGAVASGPLEESDPVSFHFTRAFHQQLSKEPVLWDKLKLNPHGILAVHFGLELSVAVAVKLVEEAHDRACLVLHHGPHYMHWAPSPELAAL